MSILHKYFAHRFQGACCPALLLKPAQNDMSETMFGLRRRERIACWPFYEKLTHGTHVLMILASFWVPNRATWVTLGSRWQFFSPLGSVSLSGSWKSPAVGFRGGDVGAKSYGVGGVLAILHGSNYDIIYIYIYIYI
jgi:hypothetical protein